MDTPQVLLEHHLKTLRLPTFLREYDKLAQQCAAEGVDFPRYLLRLSELELLDRERRATERANRDIALGRGNWTFFGSDAGGKTAAVLRSFIASCKRCGVEPFAWFHDVLSRIPAHPITQLSELLPHYWEPTISPAKA